MTKYKHYSYPVVWVVMCLIVFGSSSAYANRVTYQYAQYGNTEQLPTYRSKGEVVREIKQRYNAQVVKITFQRSTGTYRVRALMPNGKVRNIKVDARR
jgi:uncharacterized membrane protein YkoI